MTNLDKKLTFQLVLDRILFKAVLLLCFILASLTTFSQEIKEENYNIYHQKIIRAEKAIFIDNKIDIGFQLFSESFSEFSFVFIDDCIEAFQLAAFYKRDTLALRYLKKAIDMGFSIRMVENLKIIIKNKDNSLEFKQVTVFDSLLKANHFALEGYESKVSISYSADIKKIYKEVIERHIKEQAYKQFRRIIFPNEIDPKNSFKEANDSNMNYLLALFAKGVFLGEKNLGVSYTDIE